MKHEMTKRRSRFAKHYDLGNGRRQAVIYPHAVHFREKDEWKEIDNRLIAGDRAGKAVWRNQENPMKAEFARDAEAAMLARIEYEGHTLEWGFAEGEKGEEFSAKLRAENACKAESDLPEKMTSGVEYEEIRPGIGVRYTLNGEGCKEEIIVREREALRFVSMLLRSNDLSFRIREDNAIEAFAGEEVVFRFAPPVVSDSGEIDEAPIGVTLTETGAGVRMDYRMPEGFLEKAIFPIIVDPSVEAVNSKSNLEDTFLCQNHPATNYEAWKYVEVGWQDAKHTENIALFRFKELAALTAGDTVVKAEFSLAVVKNADYSKNPKYVGLYEVLKDWDVKSVTWNTFQPIEDYISKEAQDCIIKTDSDRVQFDITNMYRNWYKANRNFGMALRRPDLNTNKVWNYTQFRTRDYGDSLAPRLTVTYVSHVGLEGRWDYESMSAGRAGVANVGVFNGNSVVVHPDIAMEGLRNPIAISHYYNSCECNDNSYFVGNGWRTSMHQTVHTETLSGTSYYVWTDGDGTRHYFPATTGVCKDEDGMNLELVCNSTAGIVTITDLMDNVLTFTRGDGWNRYWLTKMNDCMENAITVGYIKEGKIDWVADPVGRYVQYAYNESGLLESLQAMKADGYPGCSYEYGTNGDLCGVKYSDIAGKTVYKYGNHLLNEMVNYDGQSVTIAYENAGDYDGVQFSGAEIYPALKAVSMEQRAGALAGEKLLFDYRHMSTHVTSVTGGADSTTGKTLIYQFSDRGNTVSIRDELGYAAYTSYGDDRPNHAEKVSKLQRTVVNLLRNHSFEKQSDWETALEDGATGSHSYTGEGCMMGDKAAKMQRTNGSGAMRISQTVNVTPGKTYTLSCFVKTDGEGVTGRARAVCGGVSYDGPGVSAADEWKRISVTFTAWGESATVSFAAEGAAGTAWFDCAQLEEGEVANRYNLIENGNFERVNGTKPADWEEKEENNGDDKVAGAGDGQHPEYLGGNVLHLKGHPNRDKGVTQEIAARGSAGDVYVAGGWAKGKSRPTRGNEERFGIRVSFKLAGTETWKETTPIGWNEEWTEWQYSSGMVEAPGAYDRICVEVMYKSNVNEADFDGIALYKEAFGERYAYTVRGLLGERITMAGNAEKRMYDEHGNLTDYIAPGRTEQDYRRRHYYGTGTNEDTRKRHLVKYQEQNNIGVQDVYDYDTYGNQVWHKRQDHDAKTAIRSTAAYTANGDHMASASDPRGLTATYEYNANDTTARVTMPNGQAVSYEYDGQRRVTGVRASNAGGSYENAYTYENDRIRTAAHNTTGSEKDVVYRFEYDGFGKPTAVKVGNGTSETVLSRNRYDDDRQQKLRRVEYANGQYVEYNYDEFGRKIWQKYTQDPGTRHEYKYAANGQVAKVKDWHMARTAWTEYDEANRPYRTTLLENSTNAPVSEIQLSYDAQEHVSGKREKVGRSTFNTQYFYDAADRPTRVRYDGYLDVRYTYDGQGRLQTRKVEKNGNTVREATYSYLPSPVGIPGLSTASSTNLVSKISHPNVAFEYEYAQDSDNIEGETRTGGSYEGTTSYEYDSLGQLTRVNDPVEGATWVYSYDLGGNILNKQKYAYTTGEAWELWQTIEYGYGDTNWKDKLTWYNGYEVTYDACGNPYSDGTWVYDWQAGRELYSMTDGNGWRVKFDYDHNGMRVGKTAGSVLTEYVMSGKQIMHMTKGGEWMHFYYDAQGRPAAVDYNGTQYIYLHNLQGDVVGLIDTAGALVVEYKYDAWGKIIGRAGSLVGTLGYLNPFRYRGYVYDEETGLYYLRSRYYNPEWGRFINADVLMGDVGALLSHNLFAYCGNSPVVNRDIDGFLWVCCFDDNGFETSFTMKALSIGGGVIAGNVYAYAESPHHKNGGTIEEAILFISVDAAVNYISRGIMQKINMLADAYRHLAQGAGYGNIFAWGVKILTLAAGEVASMFAELVINGFGRREYEETSDEEFVESVVFEAIMSADWIARVLSPWATEVVGLLHDGCQERIVDGMKKIWK